MGRGPTTDNMHPGLFSPTGSVLPDTRSPQHSLGQETFLPARNLPFQDLCSISFLMAVVCADEVNIGSTVQGSRTPSTALENTGR
jgi:hypothetical protein